LLDDGIQLAVVAGGFPVGSVDDGEIRAAVAAAVAAGVDEIDVVLEPRKDEDFPSESDLARLVAMREAAGECVLKVILETPMLEERPMRAAARMALAAGADFVKTCTGKRGACSDEAASILAYEVMRHERAFGEKRGVKLSGGIRTDDDVSRLTNLVHVQDPSIIEAGPKRFRIGASSLLDSL
jgi:deoxyribose-phosphate aldolase